ncbi:MAG: neutral/alkaline non-lysosomal ceramidase N-terminal domain-containing protein, partial [Prolixibacteraceae bacterium]|nr:neutral/alkaline non-lysosomal ceramidase N-terminal domain-containing protein [Prolixibacteraceae bacterium]
MKQSILFITICWIAVSLVLPAGGSGINDETSAGWKAGAAVVDITPELPAWMAGYGSRDKPGDEVAHPLYSKALALEDSTGKRVVIVTADILGIPKIVRKTVENLAKERYGINPSSLLMNASHTHSGPEVRAIETSLESLDPDRTAMVTRYRDELINMLAAVIGEALNNLTNANVAYGNGEAGFAMNRRADYSLPEDDTRYRKRPNPYGPVDHDVPVLQVTGEDGRLIAVLFGYACHSTTLGEYRLNGDYPGFAQHYIEEAHPGAVALFMAGCGADQNPHPRNNMVNGLSGLDLAKMHGRTLALAVEAALNSFPVPLDPGLESVLEEVELQYLPA